MSPGLPEPDAALADARRVGARTRDEGLARDASIPNVVVAADDPEPDVERTDDGYEGAGAPTLGLLAAAAEAEAEGVALHYPEADLTAEGPWLVLEPLSGLLSTVHTGTGRVAVELDYDRAADHRLDAVAGYVGDLLAAARPEHEQYPVADDDAGVFRTGMTTFAPGEITADDGSVTARFDVSTTPATTAAGVAATFGAVDGVVDVRYEAGVGVERAEPPAALRSAVEDAHRDVLGDAGYEWFPEPTIFSRLPTREKVAFGTGVRGSGAFSEESYATCVDLLAAVLSNLGGGE